MKIYEVGGCVRDEILGVPSKDIDFTVVLDENWQGFWSDNVTPFQAMTESLKGMGFKIFLETPEFLTVRAQFPKNSLTTGPRRGNGLTADFVLARKESDYTDGRRPDNVVPGMLEDDLRRRDFTMNAIAKAADGSYIDPFNGREDIHRGVIRAVGDPIERLNEDALRAVRALRFSVTKHVPLDALGDTAFRISNDLAFAMQTESVLDSIKNKISDERIADELSKMFRYDTVASLIRLNQFPALTRAMFSGRVSLDATMKQKGRGK